MFDAPLPIVSRAPDRHGRVSEGCRFSILAAALSCAALLAASAISPGSLWMDEFGTWLLTRSVSLSDWWSRIQSWPDSDAQIPLYHLYMYGWTALFGTGVVPMRASNAVLIIMANLALVWPFRSRPSIAIPLIIASCLSAPIWYYLNEIRPYIMLYAGTCLMVGATIEIAGSHGRPSKFSIIVLCVGAVLSCGATTIGIVWAGSIVLFNLIHWMGINRRRLWPLIKDHGVTLLIAGLCVAALIVHDVRMFLLGKNPVLGESTISTFFFVFYTDFGLLGIGPACWICGRWDRPPSSRLLRSSVWLRLSWPWLRSRGCWISRTLCSGGRWLS